MALTSQDLQAIQKLLQPLQNDLSSVKKTVETVEKRVQSVETKVASIDKKVTSIDKKVNSIDEFLHTYIPNMADWTEDINKAIVKDKLPQRVERIEKHLDLPHSI